LNPLRAANNVQKIGAVEWQEYNTLKDHALNERQFAYAEKIVQETCGYDNVYYEICNEPGGGFAGHASPADVDAWQAEIARVVREALKRAQRNHLVFASQAFSYTPKFTQELDATFTGSLADVVNVHPLPNTVLGGRAYMLGNFMSKELTLGELAEFCRATQRYAKPCVLDEDNTASLYRDPTGWTIHRKRAWIALMSQAHYDFIDFSVTAGNEAGTKESSAQIRTWMKHLSEFVHGMDLVRVRPSADWIDRKSEPLVSAALSIPGEYYAAYLADAREVADPAAGQPLDATVAFRLPSGNYLGTLYSPTSGVRSPAIKLRGGDDLVELEIPQLRHDVVLEVRRVK
jgi:hypothetical protein